MSMLSISSEECSGPMVPPDSPGSSISSRMQEEYEELLKYAVVVPHYNTGIQDMPQTLADLRGSFPQMMHSQVIDTDPSEQGAEEEEEEEEEEEDEDSTSVEEDESVTEGNRTANADALFTQTTSQENFLATQKMTLLAGRRDDNNGEFDRGEEDDRLSMLSTVDYSPSVDQDLGRMEGLMNKWTGELTRNVLDEFSQCKIRLMQKDKAERRRLEGKHAGEVSELQEEIASLKELLHTYEQSIQRKDQVINNLTVGLSRQKERYELLRTFSDWKVKHNDAKREEFASKLAYRHYERSLQLKCWEAWHSVVESRWKQRVEKACQGKAQEICMSLTNDYETKINSLNEALESSRVEVTKLHAQREIYEETMKKAFMRGVCALNMEAMSMFHESEAQGGRPEDQDQHPQRHPHQHDGQTGDQYSADVGENAMMIPQEPVYTTEPSGAPAPRTVTAMRPNVQRSAGSSHQNVPSSRAGISSRGKVLKAKITAKTDGNVRSTSHGLGGVNPGLAPPMSSVVVERHQPVTKQTIGHATASRYPQGQSASQTAAIVQRKIAGQSGSLPLASPNIQTVRIVE